LRYAIVRVIAPKVRRLLDRRYRAAIGAVKDIYGDKPVVGCEIGVAAGENAEWILKTLNVKRLYLVDPYKPYLEDGIMRSHYVSGGNDALLRLFKYREKIRWMPMTSSDAVLRIKEPLDFVYIDGNHSYLNCLNDIGFYYPKVRKGGIIGGHNFEAKFPGVIAAVVDFCRIHDLKFEVFKVDWWIRK